MKYGSLFTGIGGIDLGLDRAGFECVFQVERDEYATRVLERHWPGVRRWRDVREFIADTKRFQGYRGNLGGISAKKQDEESGQSQPGRASFISGNGSSLAVDLICGGFPCQPVSVAGSRKGDGDERWLWNEFAECIRILQPRWVLAENVPGLLSAANGRLFRGILWDLSEMGFDAEWVTLPAAAFGAPHLRERVFIVGYSASIRRNQRQDESRSNGQQQKARKGRLLQSCRATVSPDWRTVEPVICRGDHGVSSRVHRLRCLGNAVVPQVAEWIGRAIIERYEIKPGRS